MSGIVGVWNRDGRPVEPELLARMSATLQHRGPDGEGRLLRFDVGLSWQHQWTTAEDVGGKDPLTSPTGTALVMDGRLDNRDELLGVLELPRTAGDAACARGLREVGRGVRGAAERRFRDRRLRPEPAAPGA